MIRFVQQEITTELNECVKSFLMAISKFQEKAKKIDPLKAKMRRRYVCGIREVARSIRTREVPAQCVRGSYVS